MFPILACLLASMACVPQGTKVVFDQSHSNRHGVGPGENNEAFRRLLEGAGYPVEVWTEQATTVFTWAGLLGCPTCDPPIARNDVDILIEAMPQEFLVNSFLLDWVEQWVLEGGVLFLITDHKDFPVYINPLAARFGLGFANVSAVVGDGLSHCPPERVSCPKSSISYPPSASDLPALFGSATHVTSYGGSFVRVLDPRLSYTSLFKLWQPGFHPQYQPEEDLEGEHTLLLAYSGEGAVVMAAEAAMWSCGSGTGVQVGWCPGSTLADAEFNDDFILNLFRLLSFFRHGIVGPPPSPIGQRARLPVGSDGGRRRQVLEHALSR